MKFNGLDSNNEPESQVLEPHAPAELSARSTSQDGELPPAAKNLVGKVLASHYMILGMLGSGGMSTVYKAQNLLTKRIVAVKLMHAHLLADKNGVRRFQQEATAASRLQHPNCITVWDLGISEEDQPFLVMDYLEGKSLADLLEVDGALDVARCLHIFKQTCAGLNAAHERGVVHRDLKPSNIMLVTHDKDHDFVKLVDFGIAKILPDGSGEGLKLTATGDVFGSPLYMSPEQCQGMVLDGRSDIYSMGCVMYEALTGTTPLLGQNMMETMYKQINVIPPALSNIQANDDVISALNDVVMKALSKKASSRQQTMAELHQDLDKIEKKLSRASKFFNPFARTILQAKEYNRRMINFVMAGGWLPIICFASIAAIGALSLGAIYLRSILPPLPTANRVIPLRIVTTKEITDDKMLAARLILAKAEASWKRQQTETTPEPEDWYQMLRAADILRLGGDTKKALQAYSDAERWRERMAKLGDAMDLESTAQMYEGIAGCLESQGWERNQEQLEACNKALKAASNYKALGDNEIREFICLGMACRALEAAGLNTNQCYSRLLSLLQSKKVRHDLVETGSPDVARVLNQIADHVAPDLPTVAANVYNLSIGIWQKKESYYNLAATQNQLGVLEEATADKASQAQTRTQHLGAALSDFDDAINNLDQAGGDVNQYLVGIYYNKADVYWKLGEHWSAIVTENWKARRLQMETGSLVMPHK